MARSTPRPSDPLVFALSVLMVPTCAIGTWTMLASSAPWVAVVWLVAAVVFLAAGWLNRPRELGLWFVVSGPGCPAGFVSWCAGSCSWCWPGFVEVGLHYPARWAPWFVPFIRGAAFGLLVLLVSIAAVAVSAALAYCAVFLARLS